MKAIAILLTVLCLGCGTDAGSGIADTKGEETATCRANMQTIASAVQTARTTSRSADYSPFLGSIDSSREPDLPTPPVCPSGGSYTIEAGPTGSDSFVVRCTVHGTGP